jgi:nicotinate-nucleotide adenylyltransferase
MGVLGGTFNPLHMGHLVLAQEAFSRLGLDGVYLIPAANPPHKGRIELRPFPERLAQLRAATADNPALEVLPLEGERDDPSYTVETLHILGAARPDEDLLLLLGMDAFLEIGSWYKYHEIVRSFDLAVATRPGFSEVALAEGTLAERPWRDFARIVNLGRGGTTWPGSSEGPRTLYLLAIPGLDLSSSMLRERMRQGRSVRYLVPTAVEQDSNRWRDFLRTTQKSEEPGKRG